jgi:protein subunit release factor A
VDYRRLNNITMKNKFSLPTIDEFFYEIAGAKYFHTNDFASGFHRIRMIPKDEAKTTFKTHCRCFLYQQITGSTRSCVFNSEVVL